MAATWCSPSRGLTFLRNSCRPSTTARRSSGTSCRTNRTISTTARTRSTHSASSSWPCWLNSTTSPFSCWPRTSSSPTQTTSSTRTSRCSTNCSLRAPMLNQDNPTSKYRCLISPILMKTWPFLKCKLKTSSRPTLSRSLNFPCLIPHCSDCTPFFKNCRPNCGIKQRRKNWKFFKNSSRFSKAFTSLVSTTTTTKSGASSTPSTRFCCCKACKDIRANSWSWFKAITFPTRRWSR